jgi:hypothetical protein
MAVSLGAAVLQKEGSRMKVGIVSMPALTAAVASQVAAQQNVYSAKRQSAQQQQSAATQQQAAFAKARAAGLEGQGYTVK